MDSRIHIDLDPDLFDPLIDRAIERVLARQAKLSSFADSLGDQLLFSEPQAAQKLGLTPTALKEERLKGRIHYLKRGRQIKYLPEHLTNYVDGWIKASDDS